MVNVFRKTPRREGQWQGRLLLEHGRTMVNARNYDYSPHSDRSSTQLSRSWLYMTITERSSSSCQFLVWPTRCRSPTSSRPYAGSQLSKIRGPARLLSSVRRSIYTVSIKALE
jgi:hypothetical protein